jgi:hypothetical protein
MTETNKQAEAKAKLYIDLAFYSIGGVPSADELKQAPRLDDWSAAVRSDESSSCLTVMGTVRGHPRIADGTEIMTTAICWFDRKHRFARTINTLYVLGNPEELKDD